ncbi:hypothetical protein METHP14_10374 [Pseudomonas sp. P14-2025]
MRSGGLVVLVANPLALGILAAARQAAGGAHQAGGLALAVGVAEHLTVDVVETLAAVDFAREAKHPFKKRMNKVGTRFCFNDVKDRSLGTKGPCQKITIPASKNKRQMHQHDRN